MYLLGWLDATFDYFFIAANFLCWGHFTVWIVRFSIFGSTLPPNFSYAVQLRWKRFIFAKVPLPSTLFMYIDAFDVRAP